MYTLLLIVIAIGGPGKTDHVAVTQFPMGSDCGKTSELLMKDSTRDIEIKAYCVPRPK